jgi:Fe-S cluster assembly protein SufD
MTLEATTTSTERAAAPREPEWRQAARARAEAALATSGLPTTDHEEWRYTSTAALARAAADARVVPVDAALELPAWIDALPGPRVVFVDGVFAPVASRGLDAAGVRVASVAQALAGADGLALEAAWSGLDARAHDGAARLNVARFDDGAWVRVGRRVDAAATPLAIVHVERARPFAATRARVELEADAQLALLEVFVRGDVAGSRAALARSHVTELVLGPGARLDHGRVLELDADVVHAGDVEVLLHPSSVYAGALLTTGGGLARTEVCPLVGDDASFTFGSVSVVGARENVDVVTVVRHEGNGGTSRQNVKQVLEADATGTFYGRVVVPERTARNDARQSSRTLLLSDRATANTRPQLEIYAEDVQCAHGATVARLDDTQLFYLRSRGLGADDARTLLMHAFAAEVTDAVAHAALREVLGARLDARLAGPTPGGAS